MFYKKRIEALEFEIEKLNFKLNNPPKFKVGDTPYKGFIVTNVSYKDESYYDLFGRMHFLKTFLQYELTNIQTGRKHVVKANELDKVFKKN